MKHKDFVELVESAIDAFEKQGKFSKTNSGGCHYQKFDYEKPTACCIVGHMMPSVGIRKEADEYRESGIAFLYESDFVWAKQFTLGQIYFMKDLQNVHDSYLIFIEALIEMRRLLQVYSLEESKQKGHIVC